MATEKTLKEARKIIAGFLKQRREELAYTQAYVAQQTGLGLRTIIRAEQAEFWLGMKQYLLICEALHLFPAIAEMESDTDIAKALRQNLRHFLDGRRGMPEKYEKAIISFVEKIRGATQE